MVYYIVMREIGEQKAAVVAVVGRTNAGKSTLVNNLVGEKVSIVSPVEQTTRNTVRGIVADERGQLVLVDTPGLHKAVGALGKLLNGMARASSAGADILCVVFDAAEEIQMEDDGWMNRVIKEYGTTGGKVIFVLNKRDRKPWHGDEFRALWREKAAAANITFSPTWVETDATTARGADALLDALFDVAEVGEPLFPEDIVTDYPRKLAIADVIREKFLPLVFNEVPHELGIAVKNIEEGNGSWNVEVSIYVNRDSQKGIVMGKGARNLKTVRKAAEPELSEMFGVKVHLQLWVRTESNWMKNPRLLAEMGYQGKVV